MKFETDVKPTPKQLAEAFWEMYNDEQAEFFVELFKVSGMEDTYFPLESQAYHLHDKIREDGMEYAKEAPMTLAAPFYLTLLRERYS